MSFALRKNLLPHEIVQWKPVKINGGGLVTGIDIANDGTKVCRTDVGGSWIYNTVTSKWEQMMEFNRAPVASFGGYRDLIGVADIAICKGDSNVIYSIYRNQPWKSVDKGLTSAPLNLAANAVVDPTGGGEVFFSAQNSQTKQCQGKIAVDPANANVVYISNPSGQAKRSFDGGDSWSDIPNIPVGTGLGACGITFDHTSGTTGGKTNTIWIPVTGSGVWRSTDAGVSFSLVDALGGASFNYAPHGNTAISADGTFYLCHSVSTTRTLSRFKPGDSTFATIQSNASYGIKVACHPVTPGVVITITSIEMSYRYSTDYGDTFTTRTKANQTWNSADSPWQASNVAAGSNLSIARIMFDPNDVDRAWGCIGQGVQHTPNVSAVAPVWDTFNENIEEIVTNDLCHKSGGKLLYACWDEGCFSYNTSTGLDTAPSNSIFGALTALKYVWTLARDPVDENVVVFGGGTADMCGYSLDDGATFTAFATLPPASLFNISNINAYTVICINNGVIIWSAGRATGSYPYRSDDFGDTWVALDAIPDIPISSAETGWQDTIGATKRTICASQTNPNKFFMSNYKNGLTPDIRGVWMSDDAGLTWARQGAGPIVSTALNIREMRCIPGTEDHLIATAGHNTASVHPDSSSLFSISLNGGQTWSAIANVLEVNKFGFGKAMPGFSSPALYIAGFYKGRYGIYRSPDLGVSWVQYWDNTFKSWPMNNDSVTCMEGDKDVSGRVFVGKLGTGAVYSS